MSATDMVASPNGWRERLRQAVGGDIVELRYVPLGSGFDFLVIHRPGGRDRALARFVEALGGPDIPDFDVRTIEVEAAKARSDELRDYLAV
jgi:hypothetical protein